MSYKNSRGLELAIQDQGRRGIGQHALLEFFAQRLIVRIDQAFPGRWALKGGYAMVARLPEVARVTRDVDCALHATSSEDAVSELEAAANAAPSDEDFLEFRLKRSMSGVAPDLMTLSFEVRMGGKHHGSVSVDAMVVRDRRQLGELAPLRRRVDPPKQGGWPAQVPLIPIPDHMAEKLVALYSVHQGRPSSRDRDVIDLALFAKYAPPRPDTLGAALDRAVRRPLVESVEVRLPVRFEPPERFRPAFEGHGHGLDWDQSMAQIGAVTEDALSGHARSTGEGSGPRR